MILTFYLAIRRTRHYNFFPLSSTIIKKCGHSTSTPILGCPVIIRSHGPINLTNYSPITIQYSALSTNLFSKSLCKPVYREPRHVGVVKKLVCNSGCGGLVKMVGQNEQDQSVAVNAVFSKIYLWGVFLLFMSD